MERVVGKMHGAGNDFVVVDAAPGSHVEREVRALCDRRRGIGADGVLYMERLSVGPLFRMHFYNCDGSRAGLCLNGSRCVALRAVQLGWATSEFDFATEYEVLHAEVEAQDATAQVTLRWSGPRGEPRGVELPPGSPAAQGWWIDIGDPHLVVELESAAALEADDFEDRARPLRWWTGPCENGSNVHFVFRDGSSWRIRSFERGVEGETLACGSGCVSAVRCLGEPGRTHALKTQSGDTLAIESGDDQWSLRGPAVLAFETRWDLHD